MEMLTADYEEKDAGKIRSRRMERSIINTMRRYFQSDSERPRKKLEYAIMDAMQRYFEVPSRKGV
ncbi:MAG TPA: hypothetical protein PLR20_04745 [Syntrophales bacterium]|jgi:hypothetical protein|nr:hypothetical protein [Syntrophales bacterium]HPI56320.1 hypothetical protein [Syntrophales bacterium]HPN24292.1 hypothetical protein [Syntrophales bacterium]HQM28644.1 hypothetical protein [Syntrophales bacterium]